MPRSFDERVALAPRLDKMRRFLAETFGGEPNQVKLTVAWDDESWEELYQRECWERLWSTPKGKPRRYRYPYRAATAAKRS
jgi:hypothetical protein